MSQKIKSIRIHPGIGLARIGDSDEFYIGPEAPGVVVDPGGSGGPGPQGGSYRDSNARLKRQRSGIGCMPTTPMVKLSLNLRPARAWSSRCAGGFMSGT